MPERQKIPNPDSVTLDDIVKMNQKQWRTFTFLRLNSIDGHLKRHDKCLGWIKKTMWGVAVGVIVVLLKVISA